MGDPVAVLVVPAEGDPGGLLAWGRPLALPGGWGEVSRSGQPPRIIRAGQPDALPLWWGGALVPEGWDRARRVYAALNDIMPGPHPTTEECWRLGRRLGRDGLASRVVLLDRVGGRLVERAP